MEPLSGTFETEHIGDEHAMALYYFLKIISSFVCVSVCCVLLVVVASLIVFFLVVEKRIQLKGSLFYVDVSMNL